MATITKRLLNNPNTDLRHQVLFFKQTQAAAQNNRNILVAFNGNIGKALDAQKGIPLDYGSEF